VWKKAVSNSDVREQREMDRKAPEETTASWRRERRMFHFTWDRGTGREERQIAFQNDSVDRS